MGYALCDWCLFMEDGWRVFAVEYEPSKLACCSCCFKLVHSCSFCRFHSVGIQNPAWYCIPKTTGTAYCFLSCVKLKDHYDDMTISCICDELCLMSIQLPTARAFLNLTLAFFLRLWSPEVFQTLQMIISMVLHTLNFIPVSELLYTYWPFHQLCSSFNTNNSFSFFCHRRFFFAGSTVWNVLPLDIYSVHDR